VKSLSVVALTFCLGTVASAQSIITLKLNSPAGEWVGGGQNWTTTYSSATAGFFLQNVLQETAGAPSFLRFTLGSSIATPYNTFALLDFSTTQLGQPLTVGLYSNAQRASFAAPGFAGLAVSWQNRGSNTLSGWFRVNNFTYSGTPGNFVIQEFNADFGQFSDGSPLELTGNITMSAVPEPASMVGVVAGIAFLAKRRRKVQA
jgi:hypothetical protein